MTTTKTVKKSTTKVAEKPATSASKTTKKNTKKVESDETDAVSVAETNVTATSEMTPGGTKRIAPTRESVVESFDKIIASIEVEIEDIRNGKSKSKGIRFLRSLNKNLKTVRGQFNRVLNQKKRTNRKNNTSSGFLKPVKISEEMSKFTGWNPEDLHSRVDVTKFICNYIRENNLQNPSDKRQILADAKLTKLLKCDIKKDPLTYYKIQTHLKPHFE